MPMSIGKLSRLGRRLMAGWRSLRADDGGNAAIITAVSALPLMGLAGLAIDSATWEIDKRNMQGAADQAALAAVVAYQAGGGSDPASTGEGVASQFGFTDAVNGATVTVTPVNPSPSGYDAAYTVAISQPQAQYFSAPFLSAPTASATATAGSTSNGPCVLSLSATAASSFDGTGGSGISVTDCDIDVNSTSATGAVVSGGTTKVTAQNINLAGGYSATGGATSLGEPQTQRKHRANLPRPLPEPNPAHDRLVRNARNRLQLQFQRRQRPGHDAQSRHLLRQPIGGWLDATDAQPPAITSSPTRTATAAAARRKSRSITERCAPAAGVTIYVKSSGNATVQFSGNQTEVYLIAPQPGTTGLNGETQGLAIWLDKNSRANSTVAFTGGSNQIIGGAVYAPNNDVTFSGGSASTSVSGCPVSTNVCVGTTQIVSNTVDISGASTLTHSSNNNACVGDTASSARATLIQ